MMNKLTKFTLLAAVGLSLAGLTAIAADDDLPPLPPTPPADNPTTPPAAPPDNPKTPPVDPAKPPQPDDTKDNGQRGPGHGLLRELEKFERHHANLPDNVKELIEKFEKERDQFLKEQEDLRKDLKDKKGDEREALREKLHDLRAKWLAHMRDVRQDIREQIKDLKEKLPHHKDAIEEAKEKARQRRGK